MESGRPLHTVEFDLGDGSPLPIYLMQHAADASTLHDFRLKDRVYAVPEGKHPLVHLCAQLWAFAASWETLIIEIPASQTEHVLTMSCTAERRGREISICYNGEPSDEFDARDLEEALEHLARKIRDCARPYTDFRAHFASLS